ncbi:MAG: aldehyde dehydrogenase family protein, partial [Planctomycetaceae bacterium]|nr:aldehyde dehydrogenase family protein [Planctomycetaceae bacterium]
MKEGQRRVVGIFYITWHADGYFTFKSPYNADVTKILAADPKARLGALVSEAQLANVKKYVEIGEKEGARLLVGGRQPDPMPGKGYFYQPTIFDNVQPNSTIAQEEIFGPVLATLQFNDADELVKLANGTMYGLAAAIWTKDIKKAHRLAKEIKAGTVWINTYNNYDAA